MHLFNALIDRPKHLSRVCRFTIANGVLYLLLGTLFLTWPYAVQQLFFDPEFSGHESGLIRVIGMTVMIIGWFYLVGGRSNANSFVAATIVDRILLVPLVLIPLAISGVFPHLLFAFAVLDPTLGIIAWILLEKEIHDKSERTTPPS